jgi:hypothetical protein
VTPGVTRSLLAGALWAAVVCAQPAIHFDARGQSVEAIGLDASLLASLAGGPPDDLPLSRAFGVYLGDAKLPILGDYEVDGAVLRFKPRFPFLAGRPHRVLLDVAELYRLIQRPAPLESSPVLNSTFTVDAPAHGPKSRVVRISPAVDRVPANLLRMYVYFSHPMSRRGIARYVHLTDADGKPVEDAFLEMEDGLWDPEGVRLTLFFHPGRIKRGLVLHDKLGPPLRAGRRYRLVVAKDAEDEDGLPLVEDFVKEFTAVPEDRTSPDVKKWMVQPPQSGGLSSLVVVADKPLDEPLFARSLRVEDTAGHAVAGVSAVDSAGTRWRFIPREAWPAGSYFVHIGAELEDLAGNRLTRLFDEPVKPNGQRAEAREVVLRFTIPR